MNLKKHYFMTVTALFFLGMIVAKPGETFTPKDEQTRECKWTKGKMECEYKNPEYQINYPAIRYQYR